MAKCIVNPARVLQMWNQTNESLDQIADRFVGVNVKQVRFSIEQAVKAGLGGLARPLPEKGRTECREVKRAAIRAAQPIRENIPKAAAFNPQVEEILAEKGKAETWNRRDYASWLDNLIIEWAQFVMDGGYKEWCGKTPIPWIAHSRIRNTLIRRSRKDLWEYLKKAKEKYDGRACAALRGTNASRRR